MCETTQSSNLDNTTSNVSTDCTKVSANNDTFLNSIELISMSDFDHSIQCAIDHIEKPEINIHTLKFAKPDPKIKNDFRSKFTFSEMDTLKMLCQKADHGVLQDFEKKTFSTKHSNL